MGFTPDHVKGMSLYEFACCADGFARANGGGAKTMSDEEFAAAEAVADRFPDRL